MALEGSSRRPGLGLGSGIGLVAANMIGVGVLLSAGFMASDLTPAQILLAWIAGGVLAMAGARAYAAVAELIPRSGGEYRYLSDLLHPAVGTLAGWTSLVAGFSAPVAVAALTAGSFTQTLIPGVDPTLVGAATIALVTFFHAFNLRVSAWSQNLLVIVKVVLLVGFVAVGVGMGTNRWPTWQPEHAASGFPLAAVMGQLIWVSYAYSGWNAAAYAADEFREPRRTVPYAMVLGALLVTVGYVAVNWVFVANLSPADFAEFRGGDHSRITLGHMITRDLLGGAGASVMSVFVLLSLVSSMSAMTFVGPRVYAAMARDGFLPRAFAMGGEGRPPIGSVLLQGALSLVLVFTHGFEPLIKGCATILIMTTALTALTVLRVQFGKTHHPRFGVVPVAAASLYILGSGWMLYYSLSQSLVTDAWVAGLMAISGLGYLATRRRASS